MASLYKPRIGGAGLLRDKWACPNDRNRRLPHTAKDGLRCCNTGQLVRITSTYTGDPASVRLPSTARNCTPDAGNRETPRRGVRNTILWSGRFFHYGVRPLVPLLDSDENGNKVVDTAVDLRRCERREEICSTH